MFRNTILPLKRLLQELVDLQKTYQTLLKQHIEDGKLQMQVLPQLAQQLSLLCADRSRLDTGYSSQRSGGTSEPAMSPVGLLPQISITDSSADPALVEWLQNLGLDQGSIERFLMEEYTLNDVLLYVTREDLRRIGLRGGVELKVWRVVAKTRRERHSSDINHWNHVDQVD